MRFHSLFLAVALASTTATAFADDILQQANDLLRQQKAAQAYELLEPLEDERAGNPDYDYLFGLSLLETGDASRAIFAFERCLAIDPKNGPCRVQMARTHLAIGETPNARAELQTIKDYNPPAEVQTLVAQYLGTIDKIEKQQKRRITAFAQMGTGYDSNINSATDNSKIAIPTNSNTSLFLTVPSSTDSGFTELQAGAALQYKLTPSVLGLADVNVQHHSIINNHEIDYQSADTSLGAMLSANSNQFIGKVQAQKMWLDTEAYRDVVGLLAQAQHALTDTAQIALFTQWSQMRYDTQQARDADRLNIGLAYSQALDIQLNPTIYVSFYGGNEQVTHDNFDFFSQSFTGIRSGATLALAKNLSINSNLSFEKRDYDAINPFLPFADKREEKITDLRLGLDWRIKPQLSLQPTYAFTNNNANTPTDEYKRHIISINLRYDL